MKVFCKWFRFRGNPLFFKNISVSDLSIAMDENSRINDYQNRGSVNILGGIVEENVVDPYLYGHLIGQMYFEFLTNELLLNSPLNM